MAWEPPYVSETDLAEYLRVDDDVDAPEMSLAVVAASRAVDAHCRRQFGQHEAPEPVQLIPRHIGGTAYVLDIPDLMNTVGLLIDGVAPDPTPLLYPLSAAHRGHPWTRMAYPGWRPEVVTVTAQWGWSSVPETVEQATLLQAARFFKRRDAPFGVAGSPESGTEMRLLSKVDPDVALLLRPLQRRAIPR